MQRLSYFDNLKCILIVLVVVGHAIDICATGDHRMARAAFIFIYAFHMPLFILISGLFVKKASLDAKKTVQRVVFFCVLGFAAKLILQIVPVLYMHPFKFSLLSDGGLPWYMFAMAAFYSLAFLFRNIDSRIVMIASIILGCFVGYDSRIGDFLYLSRIIVFFPFFWAGVILEPETLESLSKKKSFRIVGAFVLVGFAAACIIYTAGMYDYRPLFTGRNSFSEVAIENCSCLNRLIAYAISAVTCFGVMAITPHMKLPVITGAGARSLSIYMFHYVVLQVCQYSGLLQTINNLPGSGWMMLILLGVAIALVTSIPQLMAPINWLNKSLKESKPQKSQV